MAFLSRSEGTVWRRMKLDFHIRGNFVTPCDDFSAVSVAVHRDSNSGGRYNRGVKRRILYDNHTIFGW